MKESMKTRPHVRGMAYSNFGQSNENLVSLGGGLYDEKNLQLHVKTKVL